jgi:hypothetical protein
MIDKKYLMLIVTVMSIFLTLCTFNETYAKYVTSTNATTNSTIARWKILVNNDDITLGTTSSNLITPEFPGSADIAPNVLAPNTEGYFDLILDGTNVDVSFSYTISIGNNPNSPVTELIPTSYMIDGEEFDFADENDPTITGEIRLNDDDRVHNIRVNIKWDDSLDLMDNAEDTDTTVDNQHGMMDVSINVIQI